MPQASWRTLFSTPESRLVCATALVEGFVLVIFPSASAIITGRGHFHIVGTAYGELVLPELITAILASLTGFGLARRHASKLAYVLGLSLGIAASGLLLASSQVERDHSLAFPLLLTASACIGAGFGMTVPVLLAYSRFLHACAEDVSVLGINALIAIGALIAPGVATMFVELDRWLGLPALSAALLVALLLRSKCLPRHVGAPPRPRCQAITCRLQFLLYAVFAMAYAVCAAVLVIWSELRVATPPGVLTPAQLTAAVRVSNSEPALHTSVAFATFWGAALAAGRVVLAIIDRWRSELARMAGYLVPIIALGVLMAIGVFTHHLGLSTFAVFILAALGCSALLPLSISFSQRDVTAISAALAGGVIAYQIGYGLVAGGMRPHEASGAGALAMFGGVAAIGLVVSALSFVAVRSRSGTPDWAATKRGDDRSLLPGLAGTAAVVAPKQSPDQARGWRSEPALVPVIDRDLSTSRFAAQAPWWEPGTASGYQALNFGHLVGEVLRRVTGKTLKQFVAEEIAGPLGADFQIGAAEGDWDRIANVIPPPPLPFDLEALGVDSPVVKTFTGPWADAGNANTAGWRQADIGAANGHGNARSVARILSVISRGGAVDEIRLLRPETIELICREQSNGTDVVLGVPLRFGIGYGLPLPVTLPYVPDEKICFWGGWGGSVIIMDVGRRMTISYMMNKMGPGILGSDRSEQYVRSIYAALAG